MMNACNHAWMLSMAWVARVAKLKRHKLSRLRPVA